MSLLLSLQQVVLSGEGYIRNENEISTDSKRTSVSHLIRSLKSKQEVALRRDFIYITFEHLITDDAGIDFVCLGITANHVRVFVLFSVGRDTVMISSLSAVSRGMYHAVNNV
jgi:hypothetical protein